MEFNAVYYSSPVVHSHESLAVLALVFDRVFFPGVYMPSAGVDEAATAAEIERIHHLGIRKLEDEQLVNSMVFALHAKHLKDFCVFTGSSDKPPEFEDGALELASKLEDFTSGRHPKASSRPSRDGSTSPCLETKRPGWAGRVGSPTLRTPCSTPPETGCWS